MAPKPPTKAKGEAQGQTMNIHSFFKKRHIEVELEQEETKENPEEVSTTSSSDCTSSDTAIDTTEHCKRAKLETKEAIIALYTASDAPDDSIEEKHAGHDTITVPRTDETLNDGVSPDPSAMQQQSEPQTLASVMQIELVDQATVQIDANDEVGDELQVESDVLVDGQTLASTSSLAPQQNTTTTEEQAVTEADTSEVDRSDVSDPADGVDVFERSMNRRPYMGRPELKPVREDEESVSIMNVDLDWHMAPKRVNGVQTRQWGPVVRIFGVTDQGNSVMMHVHGIRPYFWMPVWKDFDMDEDLQALQDTLNEVMASKDKWSKDSTEYVVGIEVQQRQTLMYYQFGRTEPFAKVYLNNPKHVRLAKDCFFNKTIEVNGQYRHIKTFECDIDFVLKFMIDQDIVGFSWVEAPAGKYKVRPTEKHESRMQLEIDLDVADLVSHAPEGPWLKVAPLRVLSIDKEMKAREGFPDPLKDPIIIIGNSLQIAGTKMDEIADRTAFVTGTCDRIKGVNIVCSKTEEETIMRWLEYFIEVDADIVTGYNMINFDLPYVLNRAKHLGLDDFPFMGRLTGDEGMTSMKDSSISSKQMGANETKDIKIHGRIQLDMLDAIKRGDKKLRSYTLNAVSEEFLKQRKEDMDYKMIAPLHDGSSADRKRLVSYCVKDCILPLRLMWKLMTLINNTEMSRVAGVPFNYLLTRGQSIKVLSQIYRHVKNRGLLVPDRIKDKQVSDEQYDGATVLEPIRKYYGPDEPISTLDFSSLYPTIMIAHNLCHTSLLRDEDVEKVPIDQRHQTPPTNAGVAGKWFMNSETHPGILGDILKNFLATRKAVRKMIGPDNDEFTNSVLEGRQLALKISANSVYGFTGALIGQLPCIPIAAGTTSYGREMILHTKNKVETTYTIANGYPGNAVVVYGDTDSVFVKFGVKTITEALRLGQEAADLVSKDFRSPIKLEFEKVLGPFLLMNKKRYAGLYWTNDKKPKDELYHRGTEIIRRDNSKLVGYTQSKCLNLMIVEGKVQEAVDFAKSVITDLLCNNIDMSMLVISKSLSRNAEDYASKQTHAELVERMKKRDGGKAPSLGDRIPYVMVTNDKKAKNFDKSEDPLYALENDIPLDTNWYLTNQLQEPLTRIFTPVLGEEGVKALFSGDHTRKKKIVIPTNKGISMFLTKSRRCESCRCSIPASENSALCKQCKPGQQESMRKLQEEKLATAHNLCDEAWDECNRCQGGDETQTIVCANRDCSIFYKRTKLKKNLAEVRETMRCFSL